jgi:hypothetical protein
MPFQVAYQLQPLQVDDLDCQMLILTKSNAREDAPSSTCPYLLTNLMLVVGRPKADAWTDFVNVNNACGLTQESGLRSGHENIQLLS